MTQNQPAYTFEATRGFVIRFTTGRRAGQTARGILARVWKAGQAEPYTVRFVEGERPTCSCKWFTEKCAGTKNICKHIVGSATFLKTGRMEMPAKSPGTKPVPVPPPPFDLEAEARHARVLREREVLWG